jgi:hypothetical protein
VTLSSLQRSHTHIDQNNNIINNNNTVNKKNIQEVMREAKGFLIFFYKGFGFLFLSFLSQTQLFQMGFNEFGVSPTHPHACFP